VRASLSWHTHTHTGPHPPTEPHPPTFLAGRFTDESLADLPKERLGALVFDAGTGEVKLLAMLQLPEVHVVELASNKMRPLVDISKDFAEGSTADCEDLIAQLEKAMQEKIGDEAGFLRVYEFVRRDENGGHEEGERQSVIAFMGAKKDLLPLFYTLAYMEEACG